MSWSPGVFAMKTVCTGPDPRRCVEDGQSSLRSRVSSVQPTPRTAAPTASKMTRGGHCRSVRAPDLTATPTEQSFAVEREGTFLPGQSFLRKAEWSSRRAQPPGPVAGDLTRSFHFVRAVDAEQAIPMAAVGSVIATRRWRSAYANHSQQRSTKDGLRGGVRGGGTLLMNVGTVPADAGLMTPRIE